MPQTLLRAAPVILKKLLAYACVLLLLSVAVFYMSRLAPGDPLQSYYGESVERMSEAERAAAITRLGLDRPLHIQYVLWLRAAFEGDFGISYKYKQDVLQVVGNMAGNTLLLGGLSYLLTFLLALPLGVFCALREDRPADRILCKLGTVASCIPAFWLSLVLILVFSVLLGWLPSGGAYAVGRAGDPLSRARHLILPLAVLLISHLWYYAYLVRNRLLEETRRDYVRLCRAIGLSRRRIIWTHCLRNLLPSYVGLMAISIPHVLGGTYIVEKVFSYPGLGTLSFESAKYHDYNMLMVLCLLTAAVVLAAGWAGEALSGRLDPRMKRKGGPADV